MKYRHFVLASRVILDCGDLVDLRCCAGSRPAPQPARNESRTAARAHQVTSATADWLTAGLHPPGTLPRAIPWEVWPLGHDGPARQALWRAPPPQLTATLHLLFQSTSPDTSTSSPAPSIHPRHQAFHRPPPSLTTTLPHRILSVSFTLLSFSPLIPSPQSSWPLSVALPSGRRSPGRAA